MVITVSKILYGIRMGLPRESFQILAPLFYQMTEVGHILAKFEGGRFMSLDSFFKDIIIYLIEKHFDRVFQLKCNNFST